MERRRAVLTIGYQHRTVDDVIDELRCAEVEVLVDVRLTPLTRRPGLSKADAVTRYRAVLRTPEGQATLEQLVRVATHQCVALMCFEHDVAEYHRSMVADALVEGGRVAQIVHLSATTW